MVALEEVDGETTSCLVHIYKVEHEKLWRITTKILSWLALDGGHANVLPFLWSARGNVCLVLVSLSIEGRNIVEPFHAESSRLFFNAFFFLANKVIIKDQELPKTSKMVVDSGDWYVSLPRDK